ncbi:MAG: ferritin [Deltaproteobacteria bacterium]|nr:ferritin [Deltaproteobacteria bacterium]
MSHEALHERSEALSAGVKNFHRAIISLIEELEAIDWYNQRGEVCEDEALRKILIHNRDEEKEHAAMLLEWMRRHDDRFSAELKEYLFTEKDIAEHELGKE